MSSRRKDVEPVRNAILTLVAPCGLLFALFLLLDSALGWASLRILPLCLAAICLWIVLVVAAYRGGVFKLPFIGDLAEKRANNA
jgi:uncharacterized membrane protein